MKRLIYRDLLAWKKKSSRKPLILQGARQVGKSYILEEFGRQEFVSCHYFNFEKDRMLHSIFVPDLDPKRIVSELSLRSGRPINAKTDLIIFDEIQECPKALTSLKYFCEDLPEQAVCSAGSLIGVTLSQDSFPVGKVEFLHLCPMNFEEFLHALDDEVSLEILASARSATRLSEVAHDHVWQKLKQFYFTGGMPQVVLTHLSHQNDLFTATREVRQVQSALLDSYHKDFAKHSGKENAFHIVSVFESVPLQLSQNIDGSVQRYKFKGVIPNKRSSAELNGPIEWLEKAGLLIKVKICNRAEVPLEAFCKPNIFKLFLFDVGLLGCALDLSYESLLDQKYGIAKGYYAENFVACEFAASGQNRLHGWGENNSEIEFVRTLGKEIIPVEVKSGRQTRAKSLIQFIHKYHPSYAIKLTAKPLFKDPKRVIQEWPLYFAGQIRE